MTYPCSSVNRWWTWVNLWVTWYAPPAMLCQWWLQVKIEEDMTLSWWHCKESIWILSSICQEYSGAKHKAENNLRLWFIKIGYAGTTHDLHLLQLLNISNIYSRTHACPCSLVIVGDILLNSSWCGTLFHPFYTSSVWLQGDSESIRSIQCLEQSPVAESFLKVDTDA